MALKKKYVVQKSFRIDADLERDLEILSGYLGRSQNELVNFALEKLIINNKEWFLKNILVDYFEDDKTKNHFEDERLIIDIAINNDFTTTLTYKERNEDSKSYEEIFKDTDEGKNNMKLLLQKLVTDIMFKDEKKRKDFYKKRLDYK